MKRLAAVLVILGLGAVLLFLLVESAPEPVDETGEPRAEVETTRRVAEQRASSDTPETRREEQPDGGTTIRILVLRESDRSSVAGASVSAYDPPKLYARFAAAPHVLDRAERAALAEELSTMVQSDADGVARMPLLGERMTITAERDGLWGRRTYTRSQEEPIELLVSKDRTLRVQVVEGGAATPVPGAWVAVCHREDGGFLNRKTLAPDGIATFVHVQSTLRRHDDWFIRPGFPLLDPVVVPITPEELPTGIVRLTLPATGSMEIRVRDESGKPVSGKRVSLRVTAFPTERRLKSIFPRGFWSMPRVGSDGVATVPFLGLGLHMRVTAKPRGESVHKPVVVDVAGPYSRGQTVSCDVLWRSDTDPLANYPIVTGRFVRKDGTPWSAAEFFGWFEIFPRPKEYVNSVELKVSEGGRFRHALRIPCPEDGKRILHLNRKLGEDDPASEFIRRELDLSRQFPPGTTDLGDVVLDHGELLVSGVVVDEDGQPMPKATVRVCQFVQGKHEDLWPTVASSGRGHVRNDGTFAVHTLPGGELPRSRLRLTVYCDGYRWAKHVEFRSGARDLRVVLTRGGRLTGSVRFLPGQTPDDIAIVVRDGDRGWVPEIREDGTFEQDNLPAKSLKLTAYFRSPSSAARKRSRIVVEDLVITPGQTNADPRIQGMELHGSVEKLAVTVVDPDGKPIRDAMVAVTGVAEGQSKNTDSNGVVALRLEKLPVDLHVTAFGYRSRSLASVRKARRIELARGLAVRLRTEAKPHGTDPAYRLGFTIYHVDAKGRRGGRAYGYVFPYDREYFDEKGEARIPLPRPGLYELVPRVYVPGSDNVGRGGGLGLEPNPRFAVREDTAEQSVEIPIPQGFVDAAVKKYAK